MQNRKLWQIIGGILLLLFGIISVFNLSMDASPLIFGFGALLIGALMLLDR
jgi:uncharacterized membrane protein HdeD (DUF308 family)